MMNHFQSSADPLEGNSASCSCTVCPEVPRFLAHLLCAQQHGLPRAKSVPSWLSPCKGTLSFQLPEVYTHHATPRSRQSCLMEPHNHTGKFQNPGFSENAPDISVAGLLTEEEVMALKRLLAKKTFLKTSHLKTPKQNSDFIF